MAGTSRTDVNVIDDTCLSLRRMIYEIPRRHGIRTLKIFSHDNDPRVLRLVLSRIS